MEESKRNFKGLKERRKLQIVISGYQIIATLGSLPISIKNKCIFKFNGHKKENQVSNQIEGMELRTLLEVQAFKEITLNGGGIKLKTLPIDKGENVEACFS